VNAFAGGKDNQNLSVQKTLKDKITDKDNDDVLSVEEFLDQINDSSRTKSKTKNNRTTKAWCWTFFKQIDGHHPRNKKPCKLNVCQVKVKGKPCGKELVKNFS
jgi:hypothetical protein